MYDTDDPPTIVIARLGMAYEYHQLLKALRVTRWGNSTTMVAIVTLFCAAGYAAETHWRIAAGCGAFGFILFYTGTVLIFAGIDTTHALGKTQEAVEFASADIDCDNVLSWYRAALARGKGEEASLLVREIAELSGVGVNTERRRAALQKLAHGS